MLKSRLISDFIFFFKHWLRKYQNQNLPHFAKYLRNKYRRSNLLNENTTVEHDKTKSRIIC